MLLRCLCPKCGQKKEYIAEQVGQTSYCEGCGTEFELKANDGRVAWHLIGATLFVVFVIGAILVRAYWRPLGHEHLGTRSAAVSYDRLGDD